MWFALGTISISIVWLLFFEDQPLSSDDLFFVIPVLLFAAWSGFRAKNAINWKAHGFYLPLVCGIAFPVIFAVIFHYVFDWNAGTSTNPFVLIGSALVSVALSCVISIPVLFALAEFCVRLQPPDRPWYQYTLRSVVTCVVLLGVLLTGIGGMLVESYKHQQLEAKWSKLGATGIFCSRGYPRKLQFKDISPSALKELETVTTLEKLTLKYSNTDFSESNLDGLAHMEHLTLTIQGPKVSDLSPMASLINLEILQLLNIPATDLSPLKGLTNLRILRLLETQASDLSPLEGLMNLKQLSMGKNQFKKEDVEKLKKKLPNCDITQRGVLLFY